MIRVLVMIAVTGFLVSVVTLSTAVAIGGPALLTEGVMNGWRGGPWGWSWSDDDQPWSHADHGPQTTREVAWTGGDTLDLDVPADVTYTQAPGPGRLMISGPQRDVADIEVRDGHVGLIRHGRRDGDLTIVMTAPAVNRFNLSGSGKLSIEGYDQDKLSVEVSGDADVTAKGQVRTLALSISGSGAADLTDLKVTDANLDVDGSGDATLAPTGSATINISGSGDVTLLGRPARLESSVSGSGSLHQKDASAPSASPEPSGPPAKPART